MNKLDAFAISYHQQDKSYNTFWNKTYPHWFLNQSTTHSSLLYIYLWWQKMSRNVICTIYYLYHLKQHLFHSIYKLSDENTYVARLMWATKCCQPHTLATLATLNTSNVVTETNSSLIPEMSLNLYIITKFKCWNKTKTREETKKTKITQLIENKNMNQHIKVFFNLEQMSRNNIIRSKQKSNVSK